MRRSAKVVLPAPLGPVMPTKLPGSMVRLSATIAPADCRRVVVAKADVAKDDGSRRHNAGCGVDGGSAAARRGRVRAGRPRHRRAACGRIAASPGSFASPGPEIRANIKSIAIRIGGGMSNRVKPTKAMSAPTSPMMIVAARRFDGLLADEGDLLMFHRRKARFEFVDEIRLPVLPGGEFQAAEKLRRLVHQRDVAAAQPARRSRARGRASRNWRRPRSRSTPAPCRPAPDRAEGQWRSEIPSEPAR